MEKNVIADLDALFGEEFEQDLTVEDTEVEKLETKVMTIEDDHHKMVDSLIKDVNDNKSFVEKKLTYPFIEIRGIKKKYELLALKREGVTDSAVPIRMAVPGGLGFVDIGTMDLTIKELLDIMSIRNYELIRWDSETESEEVTEALLNTLLLS